jgi:AraC-like DNA-binding protein
MAGDHDQASGPHAAAAAPAGADPLSDVLEVVRLTGALFFLVEASTPWVAAAPESAALARVILPRGTHVVSYHVVTEGCCWCQTRFQPPLKLEAGDVLVVPHGDAYVLSSAPDISSPWTLDQTLDWFQQMASGQLPLVQDEGGGGPGPIRVVCGFLGCDALPFNPVLAALPRALHVRRPHPAAQDRLGALLDLAVAEVRDSPAGSRAMLLRIGELMFVEVVRRYLTTLHADEGGWLGGLRDPLVGHALAWLHKQPHYPWTLDSLARKVGTSRSVLTERFSQLVGQPPMHYLTQWRMQRAAGLLADSTAKVGAVARDVGYGSEAAFSRAFKKLTGVPPAAWRDRPSSVEKRIRS